MEIGYYWREIDLGSSSDSIFVDVDILSILFLH